MATIILLFDEELNTLRRVERDVVERGGLGNDTPMVTQAISQLKECVYVFRANAVKSQITRNYKYQNLKGEFNILVAKFAHILDRLESRPMLVALANEANKFYTDLINITEKGSAESKNLEQRLTELQRENRQTASVVSQVVETKTTKEWAKEYEQYVLPDNARLDELNKSKERSGDSYWKRMTHASEKLYLSSFLALLFYSGSSYHNIVRQWRLRRAFWQLYLLAVATIYVISFWGYDFQANGGFTALLMEKSTFLPLVAVITVGFIFSSRNYKINAHLLEQYKHRYVVAKTMHNLMLLEDLKDNAGIKLELLQQGSRILFEFRPSGYMNKHDDGDVDYKEILEAMASRLDGQK